MLNKVKRFLKKSPESLERRGPQQLHFAIENPSSSKLRLRSQKRFGQKSFHYICSSIKYGSSSKISFSMNESYALLPVPLECALADYNFVKRHEGRVLRINSNFCNHHKFNQFQTWGDITSYLIRYIALREVKDENNVFYWGFFLSVNKCRHHLTC